MAPAELLAVALGLIVAAVAVRFRHPAISWAGAVALLAFGAWVAGIRNGSTAALAAMTADDLLAAVVAAAHASAARMMWVAAITAAALLAVDAVAEAVRGNAAEVPNPPGAWAAPALGLLLWCCAPVVPPLIGVAGPLFAVALAVRRRAEARVIRAAAGAVALVGFAAWYAAEETLFDRLGFASAADVRRLDLVAAIRTGLVGVAVAAFAHAGWLLRSSAAPAPLPGLPPAASDGADPAPAPAREGARGAVSAAGLALALVLAASTERVSASWGALAPPPALAAIHRDLPAVRAAPMPRPSGGCLIRDGVGKTVGRPARTRGTVACPEPLAFPAEAVPLLALDPEAPPVEAFGRHPDGAGQVVLLVRIGAGVAQPAWRVGALRLEAWAAPGAARARPLPGSVLLARTAEGAVALTTSTGTRPTQHPGRAAREAVAGRVRADVLVHAQVPGSVQDLVDLCADVAPDPHAGIRCVLVGGEPAAWAALLGAAQVPAVDEAPPPEVLYGDDVPLVP